MSDELLEKCRELDARSPEYTDERFDQRYVDGRGMKECVADVKRGASVFVSREALRAIIESLSELSRLRADCKRKDEALRKADRGSTCRWCGNHFQWWKDIRAALADSDTKT